ncbi:MAG: SurA N-terminal domain-containing protein [Deltaproteobacteria bacterium]|nr:SurA N-terminal domain-containing protein [Deltaproteobacteria bacterium]
MLGKLRDPRQNVVFKYVIYAALGAIIIVFAISFGPGSYAPNTQGAQQAAFVEGEIITAAAFERAYAQYLERYRSLTGQPLKREEAEAMGIRKTILDGLIERELVAKAALAQGIRVSDAELKKTITEMDFFQVEGKFDPERYKQIVNNYFGLPRAKWEAQLRKDLLAEKMRLALKESVKISPAEVKAAYLRENDKIDLEYVRLSPFQFKGATQADEASIDEVLAKRKDEVEAFYERNKFRYSQPKRVQARHILIKFDAAGGDAAKETARGEAEALLAKVQAGEDFAELAKAHSQDDGNKDRGGDLGWFGPGAMAKPFEEAAFALEEGQLSGVVETKYGFHLIKVEGVRPAEEKPLADVEREVAGLVIDDDLAKQAAKAKAEEILAEARTGKTLTEIAPPPTAPAEGEPAAQKPTHTANSTGLTALQGSYVPGIGRDDDLAAAVKGLSAESPLLDRVVEVGGAFYVVRLNERQTPDLASFETEKGAIEERLLAAKQREVEKAWVQGLRDKADVRPNDAVLLGGSS